MSLPSMMPRKAQPKGKTTKTASADGVLTEHHASGSINPLQKAHPWPRPITAAAAAMTPQATEVSTKSGNTDIMSHVPPPHHGAHTHKATVFPDASDYLQEKKPSKKTSATQAKLEKEKIMQRNIKSIAVYEKQVQEMGFETTPLPLPPPSATFKAKIPDINLTEGNLNTMEIDDEYGVEDFAAEIAAMSLDSEDECEFCGFPRLTHAARNIEESEEGEEEEGPLYRMDALTSEVDALMSSSSKALDNFLPSEDDHEDTPIARKVTVKGKGKVVEKGRQGRQVKDLRKTKGALLQEMITTACCNREK